MTCPSILRKSLKRFFVLYTVPAIFPNPCIWTVLMAELCKHFPGKHLK